MRSRLLIGIACAATCFGFGASSAHAYPPSPRTVAAVPSVGSPTYTVTVTADCTPGELVTFELDGSEADNWCTTSTSAALVRPADGIGGSAVVKLQAPATPGDYRGTVAGSRSAALGSFTITVIDAAPAQQRRLGGTIEPSPYRRISWLVLGAMTVTLMAVGVSRLGYRHRFSSRR